MTRTFARKFQALSFVALFVAIVTVLATVASMAQVRDAAETSATSAPGAAPLGSTNAQRISGNVGWRKKSMFGPKDTIYPSFLPATAYDTGGDQPAFVTAADVNGDGKLDLLVANSYYSNSIAVLLGNGDGTFLPAVTYGSGGGFPTGIVPIDINGDGKLDLVVFNETACYACSGDGSVAVLLGRGDGTFGLATTYDSGGAGYGIIGPNPIAVLDLNNDGKLDVLVANCTLGPGNCGDGDGEVGVLLGNGDGTFRPVVTYDTGFNPGGNGLAVGDLNGDGKPDLVVTGCDSDSCDPGRVGVLLGNGDGTFQPTVKYDLAGFSANGVAVADLNHDGKLDVVVGACRSSGCGYTEGVSVITVLLGKGDGTFQPPVGYGTGGNFVDGVAVVDINRDGNPDLVAVNFDNSVAVLPGKGDGTFATAVTFPLGTEGAYGVGVADVNGDGWPDVLVAGNTDIVSVLINDTAIVTPTKTTLASSLNPSNYGQSVTFTAKVKSSSGTPTGTVIFYDGSTTLGSATLTNGRAAISVSSLAGASHSITAAYQGSGGFGPSTSASLTQVVNAATTTTSLTSSLNPAQPTQAVTYTANVTNLNGQPITGTIAFLDNGITFTTVTVSGSQGVTTTSYPKHGTHYITATYSGDAKNEGSTSPPLTEIILHAEKAPYTTRTALNASEPLIVGQAATFYATVTSDYGSIPDGDSVKFFEGNLTLGFGTTVKGVATLTATLRFSGLQELQAFYEGDPTFRASARDLKVSVEKNPTTTTLVSSLNPAIYGQPITYTATVSSTTGQIPTGNVKITNIGLVPLVGGVATITKPMVRAGTHAITAEYMGDDLSARSTSAVLDEVVNQAPTTTVLTSSANPSSSGQKVTFTATVTSSTGLPPYGTVTFTAGTATLGTVTLNNTKASVSTSTLPTGSTTITATYSGSSGFIGSSTSLTQKVQP